MPVPVQIGALLEPGLRNEAAFIYRPRYEGVKAQIGECIWMEATSDKLQEVYGFLEAPPYLTWWPDTSIIPSADFGSQRFTIINRDYGRRVNLPRNVEDDQTGTAMTFARMIAQTYALLPHEIFFQIIQEQAFNGTTRPLPVLPKWADGGDMFESSTRYGSSSGNIVTPTSTSTVQGIITDIFSSVRRFQEFQNTQSREFFNAAETKNFTIFHSTAQTLVFNQAEFQTRTPWEQTSGSNSTGQTPTNVLQESRLRIRYIPSQRITTATYYLLLNGIENALRPLWRQVRKGYTEWQGNFVTSDFARDTGMTYVQADCREGYGAALAVAAIKVSA